MKNKGKHPLRRICVRCCKIGDEEEMYIGGIDGRWLHEPQYECHRDKKHEYFQNKKTYERDWQERYNQACQVAD